MKRIALSAAILIATSAATAASAEQSVRSVDRAQCVIVSVDHPDGSNDTEMKCHTSSDGTR